MDTCGERHQQTRPEQDGFDIVATDPQNLEDGAQSGQFSEENPENTAATAAEEVTVEDDAGEPEISIKTESNGR